MMASNSSELRISGSVQGNFKCTWKVEKFSSLDSGVGKCHRSEKFRVQDNRMEWSLLLYPGGETENSRGCVSFLAHVKSEMKNLLLKYNISLRNTKNTVLSVLKSKDWIVLMTRGYGNVNAIETQDLISKLVDDTLMVVLDVTYCSTYIKDNIDIRHYAETTPIMKMVDDLQNLRINKISDADCLTSYSGAPFHSTVVGARSGYVAKNHSHFKRDKIASYSTPHMAKATADSLMEFVYSGRVHQLNIDLALELIKASISYQVSDLNTYCSNYLISLLDRDNVCKILAKADECEIEKLRSHAMKYLLVNFSKEDFEANCSMFKSEMIRDIVKEFDNKMEQLKLTSERN